jgi:hypothetical protein
MASAPARSAISNGTKWSLTPGVARSAQQTRDAELDRRPALRDRRNFYKVERWSRDGLRIDLMLYAGNNLDKVREIFQRAVKHRPRRNRSAVSFPTRASGPS